MISIESASQDTDPVPQYLHSQAARLHSVRILEKRIVRSFVRQEKEHLSGKRCYTRPDNVDRLAFK